MTKYGDIVPFETAQIPNVLFATGWTNHQIILNRCKSDMELLFYMLYAGKEHLENKELLRTIKTDTINSLLRGKNVQSEVMTRTYPTSPLLFKDKVYLEMLGLPLEYKESKLRKRSWNTEGVHRTAETFLPHARLSDRPSQERSNG